MLATFLSLAAGETLSLRRTKSTNPMSIASVDGNWVKGTARINTRLYAFSAKVYPEPSTFGIENGNVSKLHVTDESREETVVNYSRGWDINNAPKVSEAIVGRLEEEDVLAAVRDEVT